MSSKENAPRPPVVLSIAGSDCSAGAGIQADLKVLQEHGVFGLTAITGVVAESPLAVESWEPVSPSLLSDQLDCLLEAYPIKAIKTGLLFNVELLEVVSEILSSHPDIPLIIDPVGSASVGADFTSTSFQQLLAKLLIPRATLITPNLKEAQALSYNPTSDLGLLASELVELYQVNVLVKGGHSQDDSEARDVLATVDGLTEEFIRPRLNCPDYHGTGCTLSAAITAQIAKGRSLTEAVSAAKEFLHAAMENGFEWGEIHALNTFRNS